MKDSLLNRSSGACQRAIRSYLEEDFDQFFIQAAISFELAGKACLASIHPSLFVEKDFDSLLIVCDAGKHSKRPPWSIRTVGAKEVLKRCTQLQPKLNAFQPQLALLAELRNSAIHLGQVGPSETKSILRAFLAGVSVLAEACSAETSKFFGEFAELVTKQLDESIAETEQLVAEKIARAKAVLKERFGGFSEQERNAVFKAIVGSYSLSKYDDVLVECPACEQDGVASGNHEIEWTLEGDEEGEYQFPSVYLFVHEFHCNVCGLELEAPFELEAAGMENTIDFEDVDMSDFIEPESYREDEGEPY